MRGRGAGVRPNALTDEEAKAKGLPSLYAEDAGSDPRDAQILDDPQGPTPRTAQPAAAPVALTPEQAKAKGLPDLNAPAPTGNDIRALEAKIPGPDEPGFLDHLAEGAKGAGRTIAALPHQGLEAMKNLVDPNAWKGVAKDPIGTGRAALGGVVDSSTFGLFGPEANLNRARERWMATNADGSSAAARQRARQELEDAQVAMKAQKDHPYVAGAAGLANPLAGETRIASNVIKDLAAGSKLARTVKTGTAVGVAGATGGTARSLAKGDDAGTALEHGVSAGLVGTALGTVSGGTTEGSRAASEAVRNPVRQTGRDIALLEARGAQPSAVPFRPVKNPPSKQLGVEASAEGRGELGEAGAGKLKEAVDLRARHASQRLNNVELPKAEAAQGDRMLSTEPLIAKLEAMKNRPGVEMLPGREGMLDKAIKVLRGEMEPTALIHTPGEVAHSNSPSLHVETTEVDPNYGVHRRVPNEPPPGPLARGKRYRGGMEQENGPDMSQPEKEVYEPLNRRRPQGMTNEEYTAHAGGGEPIEVGVGDVRGRVNKPLPGYEPTQPHAGVPGRLENERAAIEAMPHSTPNFVRTAKQYNEIRRVFDEVAKAEKIAAGTDPANHPLYETANEMRRALQHDAPAIALANRRYHTNESKTELTRERMKDSESPDGERLGAQLASQNRADLVGPGLRKKRLEGLRKNFPGDAGMSKAEVGAAFDDPKVIGAEERMGLKRIPIGSGLKNYSNWIEPAAARVIDPAARAMVRKGEAATKRTGLFSEMSDAARRKREDEERRKAP